jgi:hypothetical protein
MMIFQQPSDLARAMHQVLDQLLRGQTVTLSFATNDEAAHALDVLNEVATERQVTILVEPAGRRSLQMSLAPVAA